MTNDTLVLGPDGIQQTAENGPLPAILGAVIVILLMGIVIQYIRAEKARQLMELKQAKLDTADYKKDQQGLSGYIRPGDDGYINAEEGNGTNKEGSKSWMMQTDFLSEQWSIQETDIDWVYEDGQNTMGGKKEKKIIGEGCFGKIYLGEYQGLKCAVKEVREEGGEERKGGAKGRIMRTKG